MATKTKSWYASKTIWVAVVGAVLGAMQALGYPIPAELYTFLAALGLYSLRVADKPIK